MGSRAARRPSTVPMRLRTRRASADTARSSFRTLARQQSRRRSRSHRSPGLPGRRTLTPGGGMRIDPWTYSQLAPDKQYSVVVDGGTGTVTAIVSEFAAGGDNAMMYEGFAAIP